MSTTPSLDRIKTGNIAIMIYTCNTSPQIFRFPKGVLKEDTARILYKVHNTNISEIEGDDYNVLLSLENKLESAPEYCLYKSSETDEGVPQSVIVNPLTFNKPVTLFWYMYKDPMEDYSDNSSQCNGTRLEIDIGEISDYSM